MSFLDDMLGGKVNKEAEILQGENAQDHTDKKLKASNWISEAMDLDPVAVEAEYQAKLAEEARMLGKIAALDDVIADTVSPDEVIEKDYEREVKILSDYALAEMLAEYRGNKEQNTSEMFPEHKEKAKKEVASSREKAEKALLELIGDHTALDWKKAFARFTKDAPVAEVKEKDLYHPKLEDKKQNWDGAEAKEKDFEISDKEKADVGAGNGREADERTEVTKEPGEPQEKKASLIKAAAKGQFPKGSHAFDQLISTLRHVVDDRLVSGEEQAIIAGFIIQAENEGIQTETDPSPLPNGLKNTEARLTKAAMAKKADYQGWANYETWAVALWLDNDQGLYQSVQEAASTITDQYKLADWIKSFVEEMKPDLGATLWADLLNGAMSEVRWDEVAASEMGKHQEEAATPEASAMPKVEKHAEPESPLKREGCPLCGSEGQKTANQEIACMACGISYGSQEKKADVEPSYEEAMSMSKEELMALPTLSQGHMDNLKFDDGKHRIWVSRMSVADGAPEDNQIHFETLQGGRWIEASQEIKSHASKTDVIKKIAEIDSPWIVQKQEDGTEVIARRDMSSDLSKKSDEDTVGDLLK